MIDYFRDSMPVLLPLMSPPVFEFEAFAFSRDPVALDMLSIKELDRQRRVARAPNVKPNLELYRNAALLELGVSDVTRIGIETLK